MEAAAAAFVQHLAVGGGAVAAAQAVLKVSQRTLCVQGRKEVNVSTYCISKRVRPLTVLVPTVSEFAHYTKNKIITVNMQIKDALSDN